MRLWNSFTTAMETMDAAKDALATVDVAKKDATPSYYLKFLAFIRAFYNPSATLSSRINYSAPSSRVKSPTSSSEVRKSSP